jgi:hypothetical protein
MYESNSNTHTGIALKTTDSVWERNGVAVRSLVVAAIAVCGFGLSTVSDAASERVSYTISKDQQPTPTTSVEARFLSDNDAAMTKMMNDMEPDPTGDIDRDFVEMMVPHHQGAIEMAMAVLRYGKNEQIKRLAQKIIVTQKEEIVAMRRAVGEAPDGSATVASSTSSHPPAAKDHAPKDPESTADKFEEAFIPVLAP